MEVAMEVTVKVPKQCEKCVLLYKCIDMGCVKDKPCLSRLEPVSLDPDFVNEMQERMGI